MLPGTNRVYINLTRKPVGCQERSSLFSRWPDIDLAMSLGDAKSVTAGCCRSEPFHALPKAVGGFMRVGPAIRRFRACAAEGSSRGSRMVSEGVTACRALEHEPAFSAAYRKKMGAAARGPDW